MSNVTNPAHELSDDMARTAAVAITQSGRWRSPPKGRDWRQWRLYQFGSYWSLNIDDTPQQAGAKMSEFAVSSLGILTRRNPSVTVPGTKPTLGYQLTVNWLWVIVLAAGIAAVRKWKSMFVLCGDGLELSSTLPGIAPLRLRLATVCDQLADFQIRPDVLLVALMLWIARPVAVGDDSYLVVAHLLRSLVEGLPVGYESRLWDEKGIAQEIKAEIGRKGEVETGEEMKGLLRPAPHQHPSDSDL